MTENPTFVATAEKDYLLAAITILESPYNTRAQTELSPERILAQNLLAAKADIKLFINGRLNGKSKEFIPIDNNGTVGIGMPLSREQISAENALITIIGSLQKDNFPSLLADPNTVKEAFRTAQTQDYASLDIAPGITISPYPLNNPDTYLFTLKRTHSTADYSTGSVMPGKSRNIIFDGVRQIVQARATLEFNNGDFSPRRIKILYGHTFTEAELFAKGGISSPETLLIEHKQPLKIGDQFTIGHEQNVIVAFSTIPVDEVNMEPTVIFKRSNSEELSEVPLSILLPAIPNDSSSQAGLRSLQEAVHRNATLRRLKQRAYEILRLNNRTLKESV